MIESRLRNLVALYEGFLLALTISYETAILTSTTPLQLRRAVSSGADRADSRFSVAIVESIRSGMLGIASDSFAAASSALTLDASIDSDDSIRGELTEQLTQDLIWVVLTHMERDVRAVKSAGRSFGLAAVAQAFGQGISAEEAMTAAKIKAHSISFTEVDSAGRRQKTSRLMRIHSMALMVELHNEIQIWLLRAAGATRAYISNPGSENHGAEFLVSDYETAKQATFHPNSLAIILPMITK